MTDLELITLIIAIWGAFLSTILGIYKLYENKRTVKTRLVIQDVEIPPDNKLTPVLLLYCVNNGKRSIQLHIYGLKLYDKKLIPNPSQIFLLETSLPKTLVDGESTSFLLNIKKLIKTLSKHGYRNTIEMRGYAGDSSGKKYFSKKMKFDIEYWLSQKEIEQ